MRMWTTFERSGYRLWYGLINTWDLIGPRYSRIIAQPVVVQPYGRGGWRALDTPYFFRKNKRIGTPVKRQCSRRRFSRKRS
jgi:hypothetical protein